MEKELISEEESSKDQLNRQVKKNIFKFLLRVGIIVFLVFLSVVAIVLLLKVDGKPSQKPNTVSTVSDQPSNSPHLRNPFETDKTQIATSLEVPPLPSNMTWVNTTEQSKNEGLNEAWVYEEMTKVPFKGHYWSSISSVDHDIVENYFYTALNKLGWIEWGGNLEFNSFKLSGLVADGPCSGGRGALGYKDGFVRLVGIQFSMKTCYPPGWPDPTPFPSGTKFYSDYTIFISEPMPIEEIAEYISPSSASRS